MPKNKNLDRQIQERISAFIQDIDVLVRAAALEAVNEALGGHQATGAGPATAQRRAKGTGTTARTTRKPARTKRVRRTAEQVEATAERVLTHVNAKPGQRLGAIAKSLRMETKQVRRPAFMLVEAGSLRTEGQRGGTRYYPGGAAQATKRKSTKRKSTKKAKPARKAAKGKRGRKASAPKKAA